MKAKKKILGMVAAMTAVCLMTGCSSDGDEPVKPAEPLKLSRSESEMVQAQTDFGFRLLRTIAARHPGENVGFSPFCVQQSLSMLGNGVADGDRAKFAGAFGLSSIEEMNELSVRLNEALPAQDPENVSVSIANGLWLNNTYAVEQSFVDVMRDSYRSDAASYDFGRVLIADIANGWIADKTRNGVKGLLPATLNGNPQLVFILANAMYFNGKWAEKFDAAKTVPQPFTDSYGKQAKDVPTMYNNQEISYLGRENYSFAEINFGKGNYRMLVILPDEGVTPEEVLSNYDDATLSADLSKARRSNVDVYMPKFKFSNQGEITKQLVEVGVPLNDVRYTRLSKDVADINSYQGFEISIDEEGAEIKAAAADAGLTTSPGPLPNAELRLDRPFIFAVMEVSSHALLGLGIVNDPTK